MLTFEYGTLRFVSQYKCILNPSSFSLHFTVCGSNSLIFTECRFGSRLYRGTIPIVKISVVEPEPHFCLSGTGTGMHSGSDVGSGSKIKKRKRKVKHERPTLWETMLCITLKRQDIEQIFVIEKKLCQIVSGSELNRNLSEVEIGNGTTINHYGSTILLKTSL